MNSSWSALRLTSDELSLSSVSSWSLAWSWGGSSATSQCHAFPAWLLDSPVTSHLSGDRRHRACSCVLSGIPSTLLSSITVPVMFQMLCVSAVSPVGCPTVLTLLPNVATSPVSCLTVLTLLPNTVSSPSIFSFSQPSAVFLHVAACLVIFIIWCCWWLFTNAATIFQNRSKICYWSFVDMLFKPVSMSTTQLPIWYLGNTVLKCVLHKNHCRSNRSS